VPTCNPNPNQGGGGRVKNSTYPINNARFRRGTKVPGTYDGTRSVRGCVRRGVLCHNNYLPCQQKTDVWCVVRVVVSVRVVAAIGYMPPLQNGRTTGCCMWREQPECIRCNRWRVVACVCRRRKLLQADGGGQPHDPTSYNHHNPSPLLLHSPISTI
jgi:hypothetical protein